MYCRKIVILFHLHAIVLKRESGTRLYVFLAYSFSKGNSSFQGRNKNETKRNKTTKVERNSNEPKYKKSINMFMYIVHCLVAILRVLLRITISTIYAHKEAKRVLSCSLLYVYYLFSSRHSNRPAEGRVEATRRQRPGLSQATTNRSLAEPLRSRGGTVGVAHRFVGRSNIFPSQNMSIRRPHTRGKVHILPS